MPKKISGILLITILILFGLPGYNQQGKYKVQHTTNDKSEQVPSSLSNISSDSGTAASNTFSVPENRTTLGDPHSFDEAGFLKYASLLSTEIMGAFEGASITDDQTVSATFFVLNAIAAYGSSHGVDLAVTESGDTPFPIQLVKEQFIELLEIELQVDIIESRPEFRMDEPEYIGFYIGGTDGGMRRAELLPETIRLNGNTVSVNARVYTVQYDTVSQEEGEIYQYSFIIQQNNFLAPYCLVAITALD